MKVLKQIVDETLTKEAFEKALNIEIKEWFLCDDCLKIYTKRGHIMYLRCEDIRALLGLKINIFSEKLKVHKDRIEIAGEEEIFRGSVKKWKKNTKKSADKT